MTDFRTPTEKAQGAFVSFIKALPADVREDIETTAWQNSFAVEVYAEYRDDAHRWEIALATAEAEADQHGLLFWDGKRWTPKGN